MAGLKSLAKDTLVYGLSSIIGRFLNYLLVPLYTSVIPSSTGGYGVVSNVYAYTGLFLVLLTFGMETGFFRFANKKEETPAQVFANSLLFVGGLSGLFLCIGFLFLTPIAGILEYPSHPDYIAMMMCVVALDAIQSILFAYLRYQKKALKFAGIKMANIIGTILLNLFFLLLCPYLYEHQPALVAWFYNPDYLIGYIFVANLLMSLLQTFFFLPELRGISYKINPTLLKQMLSYSAPILIFGLVGILNQSIDKMIYPYLFSVPQEGLVQLGIYSANMKIAMVMAMFTQAFRYAYEPFVFGEEKTKDHKTTYAQAMKFFYIFSLLAFLAVMCFMPILQYMIAEDYREGMFVIPIVMIAEILKGIYFNLSFWYKLTDETRWGAYFSLIGCTAILLLNIYLVPTYGYIASAWASVVGYGLITLLSYAIGQKKYPIQYPLRQMAVYTIVTTGIYLIIHYTHALNIWLSMGVGSVLMLLALLYIIQTELPQLARRLRRKA